MSHDSLWFFPLYLTQDNPNTYHPHNQNISPNIFPRLSSTEHAHNHLAQTDTSPIPQPYRVHFWSILYNLIIYIVCKIGNLDYTFYYNRLQSLNFDPTPLFNDTPGESCPSKTSIIGVLQLFIRLYVNTLVICYIRRTYLNPAFYDSLPILCALSSSLLCGFDFIYGSFRVECVFPSFVVATAFPDLLGEESLTLLFRLLLECLPTPQRPITKVVSNQQYRVLTSQTQPVVVRPFHSGRPYHMPDEPTPPYRSSSLSAITSIGYYRAIQPLLDWNSSNTHNFRNIQIYPNPFTEWDQDNEVRDGTMSTPSLHTSAQHQSNLDMQQKQHQWDIGRYCRYLVTFILIIIHITLFTLISVIEQCECTLHRMTGSESDVLCFTSRNHLYAHMCLLKVRIRYLQLQLDKLHQEIQQIRLEAQQMAIAQAHEDDHTQNNLNTSSDSTTSVDHNQIHFSLQTIHQYRELHVALVEKVKSCTGQMRQLFTNLYITEQYSHYLDYRAHSSLRFFLMSVARYIGIYCLPIQDSVVNTQHI